MLEIERLFIFHMSERGVDTTTGNRMGTDATDV